MKSKPITVEAVLRGLEERKFKSGEETWVEWLKKVSQCKSVEELNALIHRGFSAKTKAIEEDIERLEFYFSFAEKCHPHLVETDRLVYTTLCSRFLLPFVQNSDLRLGFEKNIYLQPKVVLIVSRFYTSSRLDAIQWPSSGFGKYAKESTIIFLQKYTSWHAIWRRQTISDETCLWAISIRHEMNTLSALYGYDYLDCITEQCLEKIKDMIVQESGRDVSDFEYVLLEMKPLQQFYILTSEFMKRSKPS